MLHFGTLDVASRIVIVPIKRKISCSSLNKIIRDNQLSPIKTTEKL